MTDKKSHDPLAWWKSGAFAALIALLVPGFFQLAQWYFQDISHKNEQDINNILDVQRALNELVYPRYWASKRAIDAIEEGRENTDIKGIFAVFDQIERKWLDDEAYLRTRLEFYVDSPAGRKTQFKRGSLGLEDQDCINYNTWTVDHNNAGEVLQLLDHCESLARVSINTLRELAECRQLTPQGKLKKNLEPQLLRIRLDRAWYLQDIVRCIVNKQAEVTRLTPLSAALWHLESALAGPAPTNCEQAYNNHFQDRAEKATREDEDIAKNIKDSDALPAKLCK